MKEMILSELVEAVRKMAGEGYEVMSRQVRKNNNVQLHAVNCRRENEFAAVNVYADQFIDAIAGKEMTIAEAAEKVIEIVRTEKAPEYCADTSWLEDKDFILSRVEYQVVNKKCNRCQLEQMPHKDFLDLSALYRVIVSSDENGTASYVMNDKMLEHTGISIEELDKAAAYNTEKVGFEVKAMAEIIAEMTGIQEERRHGTHEDPQMYVLTNKRRLNGANVLLYHNVLSNLADEVGDDLFILPSSIHEVLAVPAAQMEPDVLAVMVGEVNSSEVDDEEILGYRVYRYSRTSERIEIA